MSITWNTVDLSSQFTTIGLVVDGSTYDSSDNIGLDASGPGSGGSTYSGTLMPSTINWQDETFNIGPVGSVDVIAFEGQNIPLLGIPSTSLYFLGASTSGSSPAGGDFVFQVHYTDSATSDFFQGMSDWADPQEYSGENEVFSMSYRNRSDGGHDYNTFWVYGYVFALDPTRTPAYLTVPNTLPNETSGPYSYILAINQAYDDAPSGATGSGTGIVDAAHKVTGSGGAIGSSVGLYENPVLLDTDDGRDIITDSEVSIAVAANYFNSFVDHIVVGSGGASSHGTGLIYVHYDVAGLGGAIGSGTGDITGGDGNSYVEVGSGGAVGSGTGLFVYVAGPINTLVTSCKNINTVRFIICRNGYIPSITRCNQKIIDERVPKICEISNKNFVVVLD